MIKHRTLLTVNVTASCRTFGLIPGVSLTLRMPHKHHQEIERCQRTRSGVYSSIPLRYFNLLPVFSPEIIHIAMLDNVARFWGG
jgi:hypothetical protein